METQINFNFGYMVRSIDGLLYYIPQSYTTNYIYYSTANPFIMEAPAKKFKVILE